MSKFVERIKDLGDFSNYRYFSDELKPKAKHQVKKGITACELGEISYHPDTQIVSNGNLFECCMCTAVWELDEITNKPTEKPIGEERVGLMKNVPHGMFAEDSLDKTKEQA